MLQAAAVYITAKWFLHRFIAAFLDCTALTYIVNHQMQAAQKQVGQLQLLAIRVLLHQNVSWIYLSSDRVLKEQLLHLSEYRIIVNIKDFAFLKIVISQFFTYSKCLSKCQK